MDGLVDWDDILQKDLEDPRFRAHWEATALARAVARFLVCYRADHNLTQTELARRLNMRQSQVARLEEGEHEPRLATLRRLADALGMRLTLTVAPAADAADAGVTVRVA